MQLQVLIYSQVQLQVLIYSQVQLQVLPKMLILAYTSALYNYSLTKGKVQQKTSFKLNRGFTLAWPPPPSLAKSEPPYFGVFYQDLFLHFKNWLTH